LKRANIEKWLQRLRYAYNAHIGGLRLKNAYNLDAKNRPVNLTLNEDLVYQAKIVTDNLSIVVESLLSEYIAREHKQRLEKAKTIQSTVATWNAFNVKYGTFAVDYSPL
jgi:antitoxin CcdA